MKPIRQLPIVGDIVCAGCPTRLIIRALDPHNLALSAGWAVVKGKGVCPKHNPARVEFAQAGKDE